VFDNIDPLYIFYAALIGAVFIVAETVYLLTFTAAEYRTSVNRRLTEFEKGGNRQEAVVRLRRERGIGDHLSKSSVLSWLNKLVIQSGLTIGVNNFAFIIGAVSLACLLGFTWKFGFEFGLIAGLGTSTLGPLGALLYMRKKRRNKFGEQFAEALDIIVRSLRSGHPVTTAIKMAARELPDPVGSEFGMVEDEITFGLDIESAMRNMLDRVGQEDLPLFVTSVAVQSSSGGNLAEVLDNLTEVLRLRIKMRRKIRALASEGRISAIILSAVPIFLFGVINWMAPTFYGAHWSHPWIVWGLSGAAVWMIIGNLVMHKMINFRF
jgi:tight adherence protein B